MFGSKPTSGSSFSFGLIVLRQYLKNRIISTRGTDFLYKIS